MKEAREGSGEAKDLVQRRAVAAVLEKKLDPTKRDYIESLCENLDNEKLFCQDFLNVSFWSKVASGAVDRVYAEDICKGVMDSKQVTDAQLKQCLSKIRKENDHCLYQAGEVRDFSPSHSVTLWPRP